MTTDTLSGFRLSPGQERLWRNTAAGGMPDAMTVRADFAWMGPAPAPAAVAAALDQLVQRHEILRTGFVSLPEMRLPLQHALDGPPAALCTRIDADGLTLALPALCGDGPTLLRLGAQLSALLAGHLDSHGDGEEPLQYFDLAQWQHDLLDPDVGGTLQTWPEAALQAADAPLPALPALRARAAAPFRPARQDCPLPDGTAGRLDAACARLGVARADLLTAVWAALLWRLAGGAAQPVALLADGRPYDELANALGPLAGPVPLAVRPDRDATFAGLARAVAVERPVALERRHHLAPPADDRFVPFPVELLAADLPAGAALRPLAVDAPGERWLLKLCVLSGSDGALRIDLDHDASAVSDGAPARMAEQFATLLDAVLAAPDAGLDEPDIVGPRERRLLDAIGRGPAAPPAAPWRPVHLAVADRAAAHPDRPAAQDDATTLTAAALEARVAALAVRLRAAGVTAETPVALFLPRAVTLAEAMLAVLRAGGAYLPLPPDLPMERIRFILADSGARHAVTLAGLADALPAEAPLRVILADAPSGEAAADDFPVPEPGQAAYILYTSGSTGRPKGVVVTHGSLANHMGWMNRAFPLGPQDAVLQKTAAGFDASVWEFYAPLMQGARLVMAPPGLERDVPALVGALRRHAVTVLQLVPSLLRVLVDDPGFAACTGLRRVLSGGEALGGELVRRFQAVQGAALVNLYGPTETTIQVCAELVEEADDPVPIGRPIDNVCIHVVDGRGRPVPVGARGEILIGGAALARGYLNRPALTAERFVPDPVLSGAGRVYRSGDIGAWRADGRLDFFGRGDDQVKLRGYRIELGEVEASAARHAEVANAAALVERDGNGIDRLAILYVCRPGDDVEPSALRLWMAGQLPDYMVPSLCRRLDAFPLNASGKIDRAALAALTAGAPAAEHAQAPRDSLELRLERVWETVLDLRPVGVDRSFFDLGGHSLLAVRLMAEVKREFGCDLPLVSLFQSPTVAAQAALIRSQVQADPVLVPINRGLEGERPVFLVHPTGGSVLCYRALARRLGSTRPIYALQDPGLDGTAGYDSVEELAAFYISRIRAVAGKGPYYLAGWSSGGIIAFEMARQLVARSEEVGFLALIDSVAASGEDTGHRPESALIQSVGRLLAYGAGLPVPELEALPPDAGMERLRELAVAAGVVPPDASQDRVRRIFGVFRRNVDVVRRYRPGPLPRRVLLLKAAMPLPDAVRDAAHQRSDDPDLDWGPLCVVTRRDIPAHHLSIVEEPAAALVGAEIRRALDEADRVQLMGERVFFTLLGH